MYTNFFNSSNDSFGKKSSYDYFKSIVSAAYFIFAKTSASGNPLAISAFSTSFAAANFASAFNNAFIPFPDNYFALNSDLAYLAFFAISFTYYVHFSFVLYILLFGINNDTF